MYCKHCGKKIADDSRFCQHCGGKQTEESVSSSRWNDFIARHKKLSYSYLIWLSINLIALLCGMATPNKEEDFTRFRRFDKVYSCDFFPFESNHIGSYDISEFIVYTIAIPLCLFAMIKLYRLFVPQKSSN